MGLTNEWGFGIPTGDGGSGLPDQAGHAGQFLTTDGTIPSWAAIVAAGTISGVAGEVSFFNGASSIISSPDFTWDNIGKVLTVNGKLTVTGAIDPTSLSLVGVASDAFIDSADGHLAAVSAAGHGRLRYNNVTHSWQQSTNGNPYADISGGGGFDPNTDKRLNNNVNFFWGTGPVQQSRIVFDTTQSGGGALSVTAPNPTLAVHFFKDDDIGTDWLFPTLADPTLVFHQSGSATNTWGEISARTTVVSPTGPINNLFMFRAANGDLPDGTATTDDGYNVLILAGRGGTAGLGGNPGNVIIATDGSFVGNHDGGSLIYDLGHGSGTGQQGTFQMYQPNDDFRWKVNGTGKFDITKNAGLLAGTETLFNTTLSIPDLGGDTTTIFVGHQNTVQQAPWNFDSNGQIIGTYNQIALQPGPGHTDGFTDGFASVISLLTAGTANEINGYVSEVTNPGAGIINFIQHFYAKNAIGATNGQQTGLYIENLTSGTSNYGIVIDGASTRSIWVKSGISVFDGRVTIDPVLTTGQISELITLTSPALGAGAFVYGEQVQLTGNNAANANSFIVGNSVNFNSFGAGVSQFAIGNYAFGTYAGTGTIVGYSAGFQGVEITHSGPSGAIVGFITGVRSTDGAAATGILSNSLMEGSADSTAGNFQSRHTGTGGNISASNFTVDVEPGATPADVNLWQTAINVSGTPSGQIIGWSISNGGLSAVDTLIQFNGAASLNQIINISPTIHGTGINFSTDGGDGVVVAATGANHSAFIGSATTTSGHAAQLTNNDASAQAVFVTHTGAASTGIRFISNQAGAAKALSGYDATNTTEIWDVLATGNFQASFGDNVVTGFGFFGKANYGLFYDNINDVIGMSANSTVSQDWSPATSHMGVTLGLIDNGLYFIDSTARTIKRNPATDKIEIKANVLIEGTSPLEIIQDAQTFGTPRIITIEAGAHLALNAATSCPDIFIDLGHTLQFTDSTIAVQSSIQVVPRSYSFNAPTGDLTQSSVFHITGSSSAGTNCDIENSQIVFLGGIGGYNDHAQVWGRAARITTPGIANGIGNVTGGRTGIHLTGPDSGIVHMGNQTASLAEFSMATIDAVTLTSTTNTRTITDAATIHIKGAPIASTNVAITNTPLALWIETGPTWLNGAIFEGFTTAVAGGDMMISLDANTFVVTGASTTINALADTGWKDGSHITLKFTNAQTVKHNTAGGAGTHPFFLAGSLDLTTAADTILGLFFDGSDWQETFRKVA